MFLSFFLLLSFFRSGVCVLILNNPKYLYESISSKKIYIYKLSFIVIFNIICFHLIFLPFL